MEINEREVAAVQEVIEQGSNEIRELCELELTLTGGGCGEVLFG
jgi:hypothetical protein